MWDGSITFLEAEMLIDRLPMESTYKTALRDLYSDEELAEMAELVADPPHGAWSREALLSATLIDAIGVLINVQLARAGVETKPIEPVRRPGVVSRRRANPQAVAYLERIRDQAREAREQAVREAT